MFPKYDKIGADYNQTRKVDPYLLDRLFQHLNPLPEGHYLDIGCGTGNYTHALQKKGLHLTGVDPSSLMLEKAKQKNEEIHWLQSSVENLNLPPESVDGIIGSLTIHHWTDLEKGFRQLHRVLKAPGRIVIFTASPAQMKGYWLNAYFPKMLDASIQQMPSFEKLSQAMNAAGFTNLETEKYFIQKDLQDLFLYSGKHDPSLYFNPTVRNGISSFSDLANREEVEKGLEQLKIDIESGRIEEVLKSFENEAGDYLFVRAEKS